MPLTFNQTTLAFDVLDYTGSATLSSYTLSITPLYFIPDFSENNGIFNQSVRWDFGDGTFSTEISAQHVYTWPGQYGVTLTVYDSYGNAYTDSNQPVVSIYDFISDQLQFRDTGQLINNIPAGQANTPFYIDRYSSWQSYPAVSAQGYTLLLYASGAVCDYQDINTSLNDKWSHLRPLSRFYDIVTYGDVEQYSLINSLCTTNTEFYAAVSNGQIQLVSEGTAGSVFVGSTGTATIFYTDDRVKNVLSGGTEFLFAVLDNHQFSDSFSLQNNLFNYINYPPQGFQNINYTVLPVNIVYNPAAALSITTNGIDGLGTLSSTSFELPIISWQNTEIPVVIKLKDALNFDTKVYPPLSSSTTNALLSSLTAYNMQYGLVLSAITGIVPYTAVSYSDDYNVNIPQSIGSFYKGYFIPTFPALNCALTAAVTVVDKTETSFDTFVGWISQPQYSSVSRIIEENQYNFSQGVLNFNVIGNQSTFNTDPNRNVYSIAVSPSGQSLSASYQAWFADATNDTLFKLDLYGNLLSAFSLSAYPTPTGTVNLLSPLLSSAAPSSLALDGNNSLWMTLFDNVSTVKIDSNTGYITAVAVPSYSNICFLLSSDYNIPSLSGFAGENTLLPSSVDTDLQNNIWVTYAHPVSGLLIKYSTLGSILSIIPFIPDFSPLQVIVDRNQNIWVTVKNELSGYNSPARQNDYLYKYNLSGGLVSGYPLTGFQGIGDIAIDPNQNAWVTQLNEVVTRVDAISGTLTNYVIGNSANNPKHINNIGGIACDTSGYLWVLNNTLPGINYINTFLPPTTAGYNSSPLYNGVTVPTYPLSSYEDQLFVAYGDWVGFNWINKYFTPQLVTTINHLSGQSSYFNIYPLSGQYNISKINENFDMSGYYNSLRYQEVLLDKNIFFNQFLGSIVGNISAQPWELGKVVYERISNFTSNIADVDKSTVDSLISFCQELAVQYEQYNYPFPPELRRLVDILSIKHKLLWGSPNSFDQDFNKRGTQFTNQYGINLGNQLSVQTAIITSGNPLIAQELFSGIYTLINYTNIQGYTLSSVIPLSTYSFNWGWNLVAPPAVSGVAITNYYNFYNYLPGTTEIFYDNIIDWTNPQTTLSPQQSAFTDWSQDAGIMQNAVSYELTKGLRLFLSASNLVYNSLSSVYS